MCDNATFAGTAALPLYTLEWLNLEHPSYWGNSHERPKPPGPRPLSAGDMALLAEFDDDDSED